MPEPVPFDIIAAPEGEPLVLTGPPQELTGRVELHNPGNINVVIREAGLKDLSGLLMGLPLRHALPPLVLRPEQGSTVPLSIAVDKKTPPGEYRVELDLAGRSRSAVLHVTEVFDLTVRPSSIVVLNLPGQVQRKQLIITNEGNVGFTIGDIGDVDLKDDMVWDRAARVAVKQWADRTNENIEELLVAVLRVVREDAYRAGILSVHNLSGKVEVMPGETASIDLEITLREGLPHNSRYRGLTPILTKDLEIVIVSSGGPVGHELPTKTVEKATSVSRKTTTRRRGAK